MFGAHVTVKSGYEMPFDDDAILHVADGRVSVDSPQQAFDFDFLDIEDVVAENFELMATLADGRLVTFSALGRQYEEFVYGFQNGWRAEILRHLLPTGATAYKTFECSYKYESPVGHQHECEAANIALYPDGLVAVPESAELLHYFYHDVTNTYFDAELFTAKISFTDGSALTLRRLAKRYSEFQLALEHLIYKLAETTTAGLKSLLPDFPESGFYRLAKKMGAGLAVNARTVEGSARGLWLPLESAVCSSDVRRFHFEHLKALAEENGVYLGIRFAGAKGPPVTWFLVASPARKALFAEVTSGARNDTYVFHLDPGGYEGQVLDLNRALLLLNFEAEALAADDRMLRGKELRKFRPATRKLPVVAAARKRFAAKIAHTSDDGWAGGLVAALSKLK